MALNMNKFTNKDVIYFCKNNSKIRSAMAYCHTFDEIKSVIDNLMILTEPQYAAVEAYWNRNLEK